MGKPRITLVVLAAAAAAALLSVGGGGRTAQAAVCVTPGVDGPGGTLAGIVDRYLPGTASAAAGVANTSIGVGAPRGAATPVAAGDLLLVVQMQDAAVDANNDERYGDGVGAIGGLTGVGAGAAVLNNSGRYEYVRATGPVSGGLLPVQGDGANGGLLYAYTDAAATAAQGERRFQVIRVPQYSSATLGATLTAAAWDGTTGGILALDVTGTLALGSATVSVQGLGFRGGGGRGLTGAAGFANTDYRTPAASATNGSKGEGIAGTPQYVLDAGVLLNTAVDGYPNGSSARGAPGNAGGGGTDGNPPANDENTGGGGGANAGAGGQGGYGWTPGHPAIQSGGFGGIFGASLPGRIVLGGGGGAGTTNNSTGVPGLGLASSGAAGGGAVLVRAGAVSGTGTINADGSAANSTVTNDGTGGGGAGGSVVFSAGAGGLGGLTVSARGGTGGTNSGGGSPHGPGGGGGGGYVALSSAAASVDTAGGANGTTAGGIAYGASPGTAGTVVTAVTPADIPGASGGGACVPTIGVTKTTSTPTVVNTPSGTTATYTITVANAAGRATATGSTVSDPLPAGLTYASTTGIVLAGGATRTAVANPAAGSATPAWGTFSIPGGGSAAITFVANVSSAVADGVLQNGASDDYLDPARTTVAGTTSAAYASGSSGGEDVTVTSADLTLAKTHGTPFVRGSTGSYSLTVTNSGTGPTSGTVTLTDTLPAGLAPQSATGTGWSCLAAGQTVTCTRSDVLAASATYPAVSLTASVSQTAAANVVNTAAVSGGGELTAGNDTASDPTAITSSADLGVSQADAPDPVTVGAVETYTVTVHNGGPSDATGVMLTDTLPAASTYVGATPSQGSCVQFGGTLTCTIGPLANGASATVTVQVSPTPAAGATIANAAGVAGNEPDPNGGNDSSAETTAVNHPPTANVDGAATGEDTPITFSVTANDTDPDSDALTLTGSDAVSPSGGTVACTPLGNCLYTPPADFNGVDSFGYTIADGRGGTASGTATVIVTPVNDPPAAANDAATTPEDTPVTLDVRLNDSPGPANESGQTLTVTPGSLSAPANGAAAVDVAGTVTYTPAPNFAGTDSFSYQVCDNGSPSLCDTAVVTVTVTPANDPPLAVDDARTTPEDTPLSLDPTLNDTPGPPDEAGQTLTVTPGSLSAPAGGTATLGAGNIVTYTPAADFNGPDSFTYQVCDDGAPPLCATATVMVTVTPVNDPPVAADDAAAATEDAPLTLDVRTNDTAGPPDEASQTLAVTPGSLTFPANGTAFLNVNGTITYTPAPDFFGVDSFDYQVCDSGIPPLCDTATVTVTVTPVNDPPVAQDDAWTTGEDTPVTQDVRVNDSPGPANESSQSLTVVPGSLSAPASGTAVVNAGGTVTYAPFANFNGTDSFTYTVCDGGVPSLCDTAQVTVTVLASNDPPDAADDSAATTAGNGVVVPVLANDTDPDGDPLTVLTSTAPANGTATCTASACTYTPSAGFLGTDTFTYTVADGFGGTDTATVTVTVTAAPNAPPQPADDVASTPAGSPVSVAPLANDSDPDGDPLAVTAWTQPGSGTVACSASTCVYTPNTGFAGSDSFGYTVDDGRGGTASATVVVTVTPTVTPPPVGAAADLSVDITGPRRYRPGANDSYTVTVTNAGPDPADGTVVTVTLPPELRVSGWIAIDGGGSCTLNAPLLTCSLGTIEVGGTRQITLADARASGGSFAVGASAVSSVSDPQTANNAASWQVGGPQPVYITTPTTAPPRPPTRLLLSKRASPTVVAQGGRVQYVLRLRNAGDAAATDVLLCDRPSPHAVFVSAPGAVFRNGRACWTISSLAAGASVSVRITVRIDAAAPAGALVAPAVARAGNVRKAARAAVHLRVRVVHAAVRPGGVTG